MCQHNAFVGEHVVIPRHVLGNSVFAPRVPVGQILHVQPTLSAKNES